MALQSLYKQFLTAPNASLLADDAALHYVTTTTSYRGSSNIIGHLNSVNNQVKKKKEDFLTAIEGQNAAALEIDTTLEFVNSGAAYLPGLDDNFLADRTVYLPITHIVIFAPDGKIQQIRQSWDQGALLKQLDVIGKTGRNWPIRDAKDQIKLIEASLKASGELTTAPDSGYEARGRGSSNNALRDPHASLALFAPREEIESQTLASVISPKGGARPRQRDFAEILGDEPIDGPGSPSAGRQRTDSPSKIIAPKAGAGKNYQANRLFESEGAEVDELDTPENGQSPDRFYRPNPKKYNHFDFADGSEPQDAPQAGEPTPLKTKHTSQWNFEDFTTPAKARPGKTLQKSHQDVRHWGNEGDEVQETPRQPAINKPRRDAETHFEFIDDGLPTGEPRPGRPRGATHNNGLGLYKNNVYSEDGQVGEAEDADHQHALGNITNLKSRGKVLESQFAMTDAAPTPEQAKHKVSSDRQKAVKMMDANWSSYDQSPAQKENQPAKPKASGKTGNGRGIHIGGDGMGGSKGTNRDWLFADDGDDEPAKALPTRKQNAAKSGGFNWDF